MKKLKPMGAENVRKFAQPDQFSQAQGNLRTCMRAVVTDVRYRLIFYLDVGHARQDEESLVGFAVLSCVQSAFQATAETFSPALS